MPRVVRVLECPTCGEPKPLTIAVLVDSMGVEHVGTIPECVDCGRDRLRGESAAGEPDDDRR
jgi:hypothetical protein